MLVFLGLTEYRTSIYRYFFVKEEPDDLKGKVLWHLEGRRSLKAFTDDDIFRHHTDKLIEIADSLPADSSLGEAIRLEASRHKHDFDYGLTFAIKRKGDLEQRCANYLSGEIRKLPPDTHIARLRRFADEHLNAIEDHSGQSSDSTQEEKPR